MKKYLCFLIALSATYTANSNATPALVCPTTITCSVSEKDERSCENLPEGWDLGITAVGVVESDKKYVLHFTGANFDADEFANCIYNQIEQKDTILNVAIRSDKVRIKKGPSMAWQHIPFELYQPYTEYCFTVDQYSTIVRNPAACMFEPFVPVESDF